MVDQVRPTDLDAWFAQDAAAAAVLLDVREPWLHAGRDSDERDSRPPG
jgi:rhodanese-related sulfurtransferase